MPELNQGPISGVTAPTESTPPAGVTSEPEGAALPSGQAPNQGSAESGQASTPQPEESFFDFNEIADKPELVRAFRQMQGKFTQAMQKAKAGQQKVEAYDAFMTDPVGQLQRMASQYGMTLTRAQAQAEINRQQVGQGEEWAPKSWDDVFSRAKDIAKQEILQELSPVLQGVQKLQAGNIEAQLDKLDPNWRVYEDDMRQNLAAHPSLVKDVAKLYRLSVPEDVIMTRATQEALKKLQAKTESAHVGSKSSTSRTTPTTEKVESFADAVAIAKRQLAEAGRR